MIPVNRKLYFEPPNIDRCQINAYGVHALKASITEVRYVPKEPSNIESISSLFEDGYQAEALHMLCETIKAMEKRILELEQKHGSV